MAHALTIADVVTLGKMGFTKADIAAFMNLDTSLNEPPVSAMQSVPVTPPQAAPVAVPVTQTNAPAAPDYGALVAGLADLSEKITALSVPSAGLIGNPAPVTSVEDIILGAYQPNQTDAPASDFMKGVNK